MFYEFKTKLNPFELFRAVKQGKGDALLDSALFPSPGSDISIFGISPFASLIYRNGELNLINNHTGKSIFKSKDLFSSLNTIFSKFKMGEKFLGGAIGYLSYDLNKELESLPSTAIEDLKLPRLYFNFYDLLVIYDHEKNIYKAVSNGLPFSGRKARSKAKSRLEWLMGQLGSANKKTLRYSKKERRNYQLHSNFDEKQYLEAVAKAKEYIFDGDIFQVNLSQRFSTKIDEFPEQIYKRLREATPAPFSAFFDGGNFQILSSSPENFLTISKELVTTRPIKGTRPRSADKILDGKLASELIKSKKDRAENIMIVDVERNDLGRVCRTGSVSIPVLCGLESFSNVHHLVSTVTGKLDKRTGVVDILKATFPSGSITGAPKIRAMEIIDELEPTARGPYTGSLGFIDFNGDCIFNILIRTIILKDKTAYFHAGGGIVADSDPLSEYEETIHKAEGIFSALGIEWDQSL